MYAGGEQVDIRFDEDIIAVELDKYDRLWIGTQVGLYRQMDEGFKRYDLSNFPYKYFAKPLFWKLLREQKFVHKLKHNTYRGASSIPS